MSKRWALALIATIAGCAEHRALVVPREGGVYDVIGTAEDRDSATRSALATASDVCAKRGLRDVVVETRTEYHGIVPEDANRAVEKTREIVAVTSDTALPALSSDDDYRVTLVVRCER